MVSTGKMTTLRDKLTRFSTKIVVITVATLLALAAIIGIVDYRNAMQQTQSQIRANLVSKGKLLVTNNSQALRSMAEDNAFLAIRELVSSTVREDSDISYGIFVDSENRVWAMEPAVKGNEEAESRPLEDSVSIWAAALKVPSWRVAHASGDILEFAAPVVSNDLRLGTIRYGFSTAAMRQALARTRKRAIQRSLVYPAMILSFSIVIFLMQTRAARREADSITKPLYILTESAKKIAGGDYSASVSSDTNDEVSILASAFDSMRSKVKEYTENLEQMVAERTEQLKAAQQELVLKAHRAGMADIATGTLHNVGNILNSVKTSVDVIADILNNSPLINLTRANELLRANIGNIEAFITVDPRGKKLMQYYLKLEDAFGEEFQQIKQASSRLSEKVQAISDVIAAQQNYAGISGLTEEISLPAIVEDALTMQSGSIERYKIAVIRDFNEVPMVRAQKTKLVHVLINLLKNAKESMVETPPEKRQIVVRLHADDSAAYLRIKDSGAGISRENMTRIFNHGFTTKKDGHGFGLHSCANYMKEMGGSLAAESDGPGTGATFVLRFSDIIRDSGA